LAGRVGEAEAGRGNNKETEGVLGDARDEALAEVSEKESPERWESRQDAGNIGRVRPRVSVCVCVRASVCVCLCVCVRARVRVNA
jgi:hypothetical protein